MPNASDLAADEIRAFSVDLERFSADIRNRALEFLRKLEEELIALLRKHDLGEVTLTSAKQRRMEKLLEQTQATIATAYAGIRDEVKADLREVAALSAANAGGSINAAVGVDIATTALAPERIRSLVDDTLIQGARSREWWSSQAATATRAFVDAVQKGYSSGEGVDAIVQRIRGTRRLNYTDGVMNLARRNAEALVRTSVQSISNSARQETFEANSDVISGLQQISTLDSRTCVTKHNPVLMGDMSSRFISDIHPGDYVIGGSRTLRAVVATHKSSTKRLVRVKLDNGHIIECTSDHPLLTENGQNQTWVNAEDLLIGAIISDKLMK